jgi:hypothetical protein
LRGLLFVRRSCVHFYDLADHFSVVTAMMPR